MNDSVPLLIADKREIGTAGANVVGWKAVGIANLPSAWVPKFFVLTSAAFEGWRNSHKWPVDSVLTESALRQLAPKNTKILVRSSGTTEDFEARGRYESREAFARIESLMDSAFGVWLQVHKSSEITSEPVPSMPLLVQRVVNASSKGHLSNERRIGKHSSDWLIEAESWRAGEPPRTWRLKIKRTDTPLSSAPALCDEQQLRVRLKELASWATKRNRRMHFEWVWDGNRLWVVQCDIEAPIEGAVPGQTWSKPLVPPQLAAFNILVEAYEAKGQWQKIQALRTFKACGLRTARIFVLEDKKTQMELLRGKISSRLKSDLKHLLQLAVVIRSERKAKNNEFPALSPHTPTLSSLEAVSEFLIRQSKAFEAEGIEAGEFCYLFHHFIPARSGAFSFSKPDNPRVRIDSTWGVPDSLLAYPHDSFEFDTANPSEIRRQLRCKSQYIYAGEDGNWVTHRCAESHDWIPSLSDSEVKEIAECSMKVSRYLNRPVEIMFFVGVDEASGHPACLPWVIQEDVPDFSDNHEDFRYAGVSFPVDNEIALANARKWVAEHKSRGKLFIKLRPRAELLKSKKFVEDVAALALEQHVPVELEGSVLSHFYYLLWKEGVQIRAVDAFKEKAHKRKFGKLVRDKIPVKISLHGETPRVLRLSKEELLPMLKAKAVEEVFELFWETDPTRMLEELADVLEVIRSTCAVLGREVIELEQLTDLKRKERGGFEKGIMLIETEEVPLMGGSNEELLFSREEQQTTRTRKAARRVLPVAPVYVRRDALRLSVVPPLPFGGSSTAKFLLDEMELEAVVSYKNKEIQVVIRTPAKADAPGQLLFEF